VARRKRGAQAFERTHERITLWLDKGLKVRFEALADEQNAAKSTLLDEAISDLLKKYEA
jgi:predicted transcriptional regulator